MNTAGPSLDSLLVAERDLQRAQLASDVGTLDRLLHRHLRFIGPDTAVHGKADDLTSHRNRVVEFKLSEELDLDAQMFGRTGVTVALLDLEVLVNDESVAGKYRYTRTWIFEDERWQIVAGAVVQIPA